MVKGSASAASLLALGPFISPLKAAGNALDPRPGIPNPFVNGAGQPILVCVNGTDFEAMLSAGLAELGGLDLLINADQDVLIKPNLVIGNEAYPTTSDPASAASLITAVQAVSSGIIRVGDCGAQPDDRLYEELGFDPLIPESGGELVAFSETYEVRRSTWAPEIPDFLVFSDVYDAPVIINFPNLKRHLSARMTCAIKNHVGTVSGPEMSGTRGYLHGSSPFMETVAEIAGLINSDLHIVDARQVMAINGPYQAWGGEVREMNKVILCGDMVATDAYCAQLLAEIDETFDPSEITTTLQQAELLGLGTSDLDQVDIRVIDTTGVANANRPAQPGEFRLYQNYPNPFNPTTVIRFNLPQAAKVQLDVFDVGGRRVGVDLASTRVYSPGTHEITFDGSGLPSGVYIYRLTAGEFTASGKMVLMK